MNLRDHMEARAALTREPTEAQAKAGNYRKGRIKAHGLDIVIENARGSIRRGKGPDGKPWQAKLPHHYGYISRTEGADGDQVDVFIGPHLRSPKVFVIDQRDADTGKFDEHKAFFGFASHQQVLRAYRAAFSDGKADKRLGNMTEMSPDQFRAWLKTGDTTKPLVKRAAGGRVGYADGVAPDYFSRNKKYIRPGDSSFTTDLGDKEGEFRKWVTANKVPFDLNSQSPQDYDMRGYWQAATTPGAWQALQDQGKIDPTMQPGTKVDPNDGKPHYPDYWKTPYHETFSNESEYATPDAPRWNDKDQLVAPDGSVVFDDRNRPHMADGGVPDEPYRGANLGPLSTLPDVGDDTALSRFADQPFSAGTKAGNRLFGTGGEDRYVTWPEQAIRDMVTLPQRAIDASATDVQNLDNPDRRVPESTKTGLEAALATMGGTSISAPADAMGAGPVRRAALDMSPEARMARAAEQGFEGPWYHGSARTDRLTENGKIDPRRATSGPMPFFTDDPKIASNYARAKGDTSLAATDTGNVADYFTVPSKAIGWGGRSDIPVEKTWNYLPPEVRSEIAARARRIGYQNLEEADGPLMLHPEGVDGVRAGGTYERSLAENRGNHLAALRDIWHDSGRLYDNPSELSDIYKLAGYPYEISQKNAPWTEAQGVLPAMLRMRNPLHTENSELMVNTVLPKLEEMFKRDRTNRQEFSATDQWDKNSRYTPKEWIAQAKEDYAKGDNSFVWTSIPDKISKALRSMGYDGMIDTGGKMGGQGHKVAIPFGPEQVRSTFAKFDPKNEGKSMLLGAGAGDRRGAFYSGVEAALEGIQQPKMSGQQWLGTLSNRPGVKPEEMQWTGLQDFLAGRGNAPVTKQEIADHLASNKIELHDVVKGGGATNEQAFELAKEHGWKSWDEIDPPTQQKYLRRAQKEFGDADLTKYHKYQLPGGENYREMLMTLPQSQGPFGNVAYDAANVMMRDLHAKYGNGWRLKATPEEVAKVDQLESRGEMKAPDYRSSHWDEPNILAHVRMNDRDIGGKKALHLEEIQSDWHQQGRDRGYNVKPKIEIKPEKFEGREVHRVYVNGEPKMAYSDRTQAEQYAPDLAPNAVPDAPFKKTWHELALKRMLREAAEKGYDRLSWTPGEAQAARYDLSKQVNYLLYQKNPDGSFRVSAQMPGERGQMLGENLTESQLADHVGKDVAKRMAEGSGQKTNLGGNSSSQPPDHWMKLSGEGLKVGGEGMKGFYDQIIPKALEKIGKEHGVSVKRGELPFPRLSNKIGEPPIPDPVWYIDIPQSLKDQAMKKGFSMFADGGRVRGYADGGTPYTGDNLGPLSSAPAFDETSPVDASVPAFDQTQPVVEDKGALNAFGRGAYQGATLNFGDELRGLGEAGGVKPDEWNDPISTIRGGYRYFTGEPGAEDAYNTAVARERATDKATAETHPWAFHGGEFAGAVAPMMAIPGGPLAEGATFGSRVAQGVRAGATYGGLSGAGEGTDAGSRVLNAGVGTLTGGVGGGAAVPLSEGVSFAIKKMLGPAWNAVVGLARGSENEAARRVFSAIEADSQDIAAGKMKGMPVQDWLQARAAGEPVMLADLGGARTQSLLRSAANTSPEGRGILEKSVEDRFAGQADRVAADVRNLVQGGANAGKRADQLVAEYDAGRAPLYQRAFAQPAAQQLWTPELQQMAEAPLVQQAMRMATMTGRNEAAKLGMPQPINPFTFNRDGSVALTNPNLQPNLQYWDVVKKNLDGGDRNAQQWAKALRQHLDEHVPSYADARGFAANFFGERDALEAGRAMAGKNMDPEVIAKAMRKMDPDEKDLFREGYASDWANRVIGNFRDSRDITKAMFNSPNERKRAEIIFGPAGVKTLENRMTLETVMDGARKAMGNSTTARQLIEAGLAGGALGYYEGGDWKSAMTGAGAGAFARKALTTEMAAGARHLIGRVDAKTAARVAELLTSDDPRKLAQGLRIMNANQAVANGMRNIANRMAVAGQSPASGSAAALPYRGMNLGPLMPANADQNQQQP